MALDLNCRECQAGLSQVGQMAIGFRCFDHGNIGLEISELMKMAKASEAAQCCKDICWMCEKGETIFYSKGVYKHAVTGELNAIDCHADAIRQRLAGGKKEGE